MKTILLIGGSALAVLAAILAVREFSGQPHPALTPPTVASAASTAAPAAANAPAAVPAAPKVETSQPAVAPAQSPAPPAPSSTAAASPAPGAPSPAPVAAGPSDHDAATPGSGQAMASAGLAAAQPDAGAAPAPAASDPVAAPPAPQPASASAASAALATSPDPAVPGPATADPAAPAADGRSVLGFDAIRVSADGAVTIAGRGPAGARILLFDGDRQIGSAEADASGAWVFISDTPIASGDHQLSLRVADGGPAAASSEVAMVVVPQRGRDIAGRPAAGGDTSPLVVLTPQQGNGASTVLQAPAANRDAAAAPASGGPLPSIDVIDYGEGGAVIVSGRGVAEAVIRLYLDDRSVGEGRADGQGLFRIQADGGIQPGVYHLRADQLDASGRVTGRAEIPFQRATPAEIAVAEGRVVVQPGNSLWRIARRVYGEGLRYTVIYQANEDQIRNPDLIYPGQIFAVPAGQAAAVPG